MTVISNPKYHGPFYQEILSDYFLAVQFTGDEVTFNEKYVLLASKSMGGRFGYFQQAVY